MACESTSMLRHTTTNDDDDDDNTMTTTTATTMITTTTTPTTLIVFKGANRDCLHSPHCATNCLQHVRSGGQGTVVCKSRATHLTRITCIMSCATLYEGTIQLLSLTELNSSIVLACNVVGTMRLYNINDNLIRNIECLYNKETSAIYHDNNIGEWFRTTIGVRQGCLLSPTLFNIFSERIMADALEKIMKEQSVSEARQLQTHVLLTTLTA